MNVSAYVNRTLVEMSAYGPDGYFDFGFEVTNASEVRNIKCSRSKELRAHTIVNHTFITHTQRRYPNELEVRPANIVKQSTLLPYFGVCERVCVRERE